MVQLTKPINMKSFFFAQGISSTIYDMNWVRCFYISLDLILILKISHVIFVRKANRYDEFLVFIL